ncbi:MAG TPA: S49 family peptidase [Verrucomicrobiae bacterium]|nr:S49 family peptidase [Verrucomicrobiae bacterium]
MKFPKLLSEELLLITPPGYARLALNFNQAGNLMIVDQAKREAITPYGTELDIGQMEIIDGVAVVPITGLIGKGLDAYDKFWGATDVDDVDDDLDEAEDDDQVRAILLDIDSPGGMVTGTPELADRIQAVNKPIFAFTAGQACSAAYWLAAACDGIFATRSADIGCIGVYSTFLDLSEMAKKLGIKVQVFSSGAYKGMGMPGTSLSSAQQQMIQERIMEIAQMFYDHVQAARPDVIDDDMQGQWFKGAAAAARGLIDQVVSDRDQVLAML